MTAPAKVVARREYMGVFDQDLSTEIFPVSKDVCLGVRLPLRASQADSLVRESGKNLLMPSCSSSDQDKRLETKA